MGKKYAPELDRLARTHAPSGFAFVFVAVENGRPDDFVGTTFEGKIWRDPESRLLGPLGARRSTEVFVLDAARTLVYRGAIDDRYGLDFSRDAGQSDWLVILMDSKGAIRRRSLREDGKDPRYQRLKDQVNAAVTPAAAAAQ